MPERPTHAGATTGRLALRIYTRQNSYGIGIRWCDRPEIDREGITGHERSQSGVRRGCYGNNIEERWHGVS